MRRDGWMGGLSSVPDPFQGLLFRRDGEIVYQNNVAKDE